ncbi:ABC transporter substrate-binding protein [Pseudoduganella armeniaca]|uniref:ABC transporter substrate-binding protein n=1 Tax=Pseudoduganella armeniaca TaxID=2072590 RepID=A0A2R4CCG6_9BURK|nr:hypothetical protein [Pseudoduganella armeniaca]AVR97180.1 hypothetical protein C9I28_17190 [Pseudoduganella armeniaca]
MKSPLEKCALGAFLVSALVLFGWLSMHRPVIFILHSYDTGYAWVRDINVGINRVLKQPYLYRTQWYYMDTKRHPFEEHNLRAGSAARHAIDRVRPDILIAIDDDAQRFAARYYIGDPHMKIVFAGVNGTARDYGYDRARNVTGILERLPLDALLEALASARAGPAGVPLRRVAVLGERSVSVSGDMAQIARYDWHPLTIDTIVQVATWPEWQHSVLSLGARNDALLLAGYRGLARSPHDRTLVPPAEVAAWTEAHSPVPVIALNAFHIEDGGMLAIGTSPYELGEVAARLALDLALEQVPVASRPITESHQFIVSMSGARLSARGFWMPRIYEAAARTGDLYRP